MNTARVEQSGASTSVRPPIIVNQTADPVYSHPKIVLTPHVSWTGGEDVRRLVDKTLLNLDAYVHGAPLADVFNRDLEY